MGILTAMVLVPIATVVASCANPRLGQRLAARADAARTRCHRPIRAAVGSGLAVLALLWLCGVG
jgi:hypothetical protein